MAHTVTDMMFNFYGTISYDDRKSAPIEVTLAYNQNISNPYSNLVDWATLYRDELPALTLFFNKLLPNTIPLIPSATAAAHHVTDFNLLMTGLVTYDDNTQSSFVVEYQNGVVDFTPATTAQDWDDMVGHNSDLMAEVFGRVTTTDIPGLPAFGPATVNLLTAADFAIFAKTAITEATGGDVITGDMGINPGAASAITGFALVLDGGGTFSTSSQVIGKVYASDYTAPTPAKVLQAMNDMQAAYTDAANRPGAIMNLSGGLIGGLTLAPGLYKWGTAVTIPVGTSLTLNGGANDTWILQITGALTTGASTTVTLTGGAQAKNVFWQVAGGVTLGASAHLEGNILSATTINLGALASVNGRLLAQTAVNMDQVVVTKPS